MKAQHSLLSIAAAMVAATLVTDAPGAEEASATLSPQALQEITQVEAEIERIEAQTIERLAVPPDNQVQQIELLGKLMLYDKQLSVNRNEACAFCHMPEAGFTGPVSELNRTTGSYPGSVRTRFSNRKPQSHAYAPLSTKALIERAAQLERRKVTDFCMTALTDAARRTIAEHETLVLSDRDRAVFFEALVNPPAPSERLQRAFEEHKRRVIP